LHQRDILLLRIEDADGYHGWGEAAPFPEFGTESMENCHLSLHRAVGVIPHFPSHAYEAAMHLDSILPTLATTPAARFAVETALLDLAAKQRSVTLRTLLNERSVHRVPVNALITAGSVKDIAAAALAAVHEGYSCLKIKIGTGTLDDDIERVRAVRDAVGNDVLLRLDVNGAWEMNIAVEAAQRLADFGIEYLEQPVACDERVNLAALRALQLLPIAADESAQRLDDAFMLLDSRAVDILVVKPMASGSLLSCRSLAHRALEQGCDLVLTTFLDSAIGRHAVAQLAASLPELTRHHGLATGRLFARDTGRDELHAGYFELPNGFGLGIEAFTGGQDACT